MLEKSLDQGGLPQPRGMGPAAHPPAVALLAIVGLGGAQWVLEQVPLPGLNHAAIKEWGDAFWRSGVPSVSYTATFSLGALGILPYFTAAVVIQLLYVLVRQLGGATVREATTPRVDRAVLAFTLVVALVQGWFIARYFERIGIPGTNQSLVLTGGLAFRVVATSALAASTFLLLALARAATRLAQVNGVGCLLAIGTARLMWIGTRVAVIEESLPQFVLPVAVGLGLSFVLLRTTRPFALCDGLRRTRPVRPSLRIPLGPAGGAPLAFGGTVLACLQLIQLRGGLIPSSVSFLQNDGLPALAILVTMCVGLSYLWLSLFRVPERTAEGMRAAGLFVRGVRPGSDTEARMRASWVRPTLAGAGILAALAIEPALPPLIGGIPSRSTVSLLGGGSTLILVAMGMELYERLRRPGGAPAESALVPTSAATTSDSTNAGRCPGCSVEVADRFTVCWSCGGPVTPIAPPPPAVPLPEAPAGGGAPTTVARMTFPIDAEMARLALESEGIPVRVLDAHLVAANWFLAMAVGGIRVQVPAECAARARNLLFPAPDGADRPDGRGAQAGSAS
ncbi:MAG: DUF2007 domain-containing protein [Planctomycetota bacterium]